MAVLHFRPSRSGLAPRCRRQRSLALAVCAALLAWAPSAGAQQPDTRKAPQRAQGWQITLENDVLARERRDQWYTNGLRVSYTVREPNREDDALASRLLELGRSLALGATVVDGGLVTYTLGQNIYTPRRIELAEPQRFDRPWAGWLFAGATVQGFAKQGGLFGRAQGEYQQTDLKVGVTGRASLADRAQRWVHHEIESTYPAGWEQQLKQQLGVQLSHLRVFRFGDTTGTDRFSFHGGGGLTVGNLRSYGTLVAGVVAGRLAGRNPVFVPANEGDFVIQDFDDKATDHRWLAFFNFSVAAVASNRFITGPTPYGRAEVKLRRWVPTWQWGLQIPLGTRHRLVYTQTARRAEFESVQIGARENLQRWGGLTLNIDLER
jgi:lipid A 3-O-deacylase